MNLVIHAHGQDIDMHRAQLALQLCAHQHLLKIQIIVSPTLVDLSEPHVFHRITLWPNRQHLSLEPDHHISHQKVP